MSITFLQKNNRFAYLLTLVGCCCVTSFFAQTEISDTMVFFGKRRIYPYYHPVQPSLAKDFHTLKKEFASAVTAKTEFSGLITIIFIVNYKGETGFYRTQFTDLQYQPLQPGTPVQVLCEQLLQAVKSCRPWKPSKDADGNAVNSRKFYSFKFVNGSLVEILPK